MFPEILYNLQNILPCRIGCMYVKETSRNAEQKKRGRKKGSVILAVWNTFSKILVPVTAEAKLVVSVIGEILSPT